MLGVESFTEKSLSTGRVDSTISLKPLPRSLLPLPSSTGCVLPLGGTGAWESSPLSIEACPDHPRFLVQQPHTPLADSGSGVGPRSPGRRPGVENKGERKCSSLQKWGILRIFLERSSQ